MGDIAEMMLDGEICALCGDGLDGGSPGYVRYCKSCQKAEQPKKAKAIASIKPPANQKTACPTCGRRVKLTGIKDHMRDAHAPS